MRLKFFVLASVAVLPLVSGCATTPQPLAAIGPGTIGKPGRGPDGYLQVYTATRTVDADYHAYFDMHEGYDIYDGAGNIVQFVPNHDSNIDETIDQVNLRPGKYVVIARSTWCGLMRVPVEVVAGRITAVHLDGNNWSPSPRPAASELVFLPNGEVAGWKSSNP